MPTVDNELLPTRSSQSGGSRQPRPLPAFKAPSPTAPFHRYKGRCPRMLLPASPTVPPAPRQGTSSPTATRSPPSPSGSCMVPDTTALRNVLKVTATAQELHSEHPGASSFPGSQVLQRPCVKHTSPPHSPATCREEDMSSEMLRPSKVCTTAGSHTGP